MSFLCSLINFWNVSFWFFPFSQLYIEMTEQNISTEQNLTFFPLSLSAQIWFFRIFHSSLAQGSFAASPNFPSNHTEECIPLSPVHFTQLHKAGQDDWRTNWSKLSTVSSLQEEENPAQATRAEHSTHPSFPLFLKPCEIILGEAMVQFMFCTQQWQCLGRTWNRTSKNCHFSFQR